MVETTRMLEPLPTSRSRRLLWLGAGWTAVAVGLLTVIGGWSVLAGIREPGYAVYNPLLVFNSAMGVWYLAAGILILSRRPAGRWSAGLIALANALVLAALLVLPAPVAMNTLVAMGFRTGLWVAVYGVLRWPGRPREV
jgi:hypothetical protein